MGTTQSSLGQGPPPPLYQRGSFVRVLNNLFAPPGARFDRSSRNCEIGVVVGGQGLTHHVVLFADQTCRAIETSALKFVQRVSRRHRSLLNNLVEKEMRARLRDRLRNVADFDRRCAFAVGEVVSLAHVDDALLSEITNTNVEQTKLDWRARNKQHPFIGVVSCAAAVACDGREAVLVTFGAPVLNTVAVGAEHLAARSTATVAVDNPEHAKSLERLACMVREECGRERARTKDEMAGDSPAPVASHSDLVRISKLESVYQTWCVRGVEQLSAPVRSREQTHRVPSVPASCCGKRAETLMRIDALLQHIDNLERLLIESTNHRKSDGGQARLRKQKSTFRQL